MTSTLDAPLRSRSVAYLTVVGAVVALLAAGLAVPYLFGHPDAGGRTTGLAIGGPGSPSAQPAGVLPNGAVAGGGSAATAGGGGGFGRLPASASAASSGGAAAGRAGARGAGATAPGVSDHQIRLGIPIFDLGNLPVNGINPAQQEAQWNSYLDAVNKAGGVEGRQLVPVYAGYNPLQEDSSRAACLALTQDTQVFAVLAYGLFDNQVGCFSQEHAVPLVNGIGVSDATMAASGRRMLTVNISKDRALRDQALLVAQMGVLQGKTVGIVTSTDRNDNASVDAALVPTLRQLGVKVAHTSNLSSDEGTALAQLPVEVRAMQAAGVNVVFLAANLLYSGYFVEDADSQGYHPQYTTSDFEQLVEDGETNMFTAGFDGAIGITALRSGEQRVGDAEPPFDARCRQIYQSVSGESYQRGDLEYDTTEAMCSVVDITAKALALASPSLTRDGFIAAAETLNNFDLAYSAPGSFSVTKHDAPQSLRVARWHYACKCWVPTSAFAPAPS